MLVEKLEPRPWDNRRNIIVPGDLPITITFCVEHFVLLAKKAIKDHDAFFVALSGGSTPKTIFEHLSSPPYNEMVEWNKVHLFWSDERAVSPENPESNYHMAMQAGLAKMPMTTQQIHRMKAEEKIEENALLYEQEIAATLKGRPFDMIMLGMGEDGHTASLFPHTEALKIENRLAVANYIPQKHTWRMTLTYPCINQALCSVIYVLGTSKKSILAEVLLTPDQFERYPVQHIGTPTNPALWITDQAAAEGLIDKREKLS